MFLFIICNFERIMNCFIVIKHSCITSVNSTNQLGLRAANEGTDSVPSCRLVPDSENIKMEFLFF